MIFQYFLEAQDLTQYHPLEDLHQKYILLVQFGQDEVFQLYSYLSQQQEFYHY